MGEEEEMQVEHFVKEVEVVEVVVAVMVIHTLEVEVEVEVGVVYLVRKVAVVVVEEMGYDT